MSDISQIQVNGTTYDLCDATARTDIANLQDSVGRIRVVPFSKTETINGSSYKSFYFDMSEERGKCLGFIGVKSSLGYMSITAMCVNSKTDAFVILYNPGTGATSVTVDVRALFIN